MLRGRGGVLTGIYLADHERCPRPAPDWVRHDAGLDDATRQLDEYFAGTRTTFDVEIDLEGTDFQRRVWRALLSVPYGQTATYRDIAESIGAPTAARAVGAANGRNPISIVVPCHRIIGADGTLTGYGWGQTSKAWLLAHEQRYAAPDLPPITTQT
jgi:methylated-DNA-[protein]-cysteine S-methyltransferase